MSKADELLQRLWAGSESKPNADYLIIRRDIAKKIISDALENVALDEFSAAMREARDILGPEHKPADIMAHGELQHNRIASIQGFARSITLLCEALTGQEIVLPSNVLPADPPEGKR